MRIYLTATVITLALLSAQANAQRTADRAGTWDVGLHLADTSSEQVSGDFGSALSIDNELAWGFTGGYNFTNRLAVGLDVNWSDPDYDLTYVPDTGPPLQRTISASLDMTTVQLKGIFNFLDGPFTPYVEAGFGWTYVDSNIVDGLPETGCWWDPWWGYVCANFYETYDDTQTSYSAAVGLRWDMSEAFMVRASYGTLEINADKASNVSLETLQVDFAFRF
jgi:opacity protein-like surface antigen